MTLVERSAIDPLGQFLCCVLRSWFYDNNNSQISMMKTSKKDINKVNIEC